MTSAREGFLRWIQRMHPEVFDDSHLETNHQSQPSLVVNYNGPVYQISTNRGPVRVFSDDYVYQQTIQPIINQVDEIIRRYPQYAEDLERHKEHIANAKNKKEKIGQLDQLRNWFSTNKDAITCSTAVIATISKVLDIVSKAF